MQVTHLSHVPAQLPTTAQFSHAHFSGFDVYGYKKDTDISGFLGNLTAHATADMGYLLLSIM